MHRRRLIIVASLGALLLVAAGAGVAYDRGRADTIARGVHVGGVDLGGLDRDAARAKLQAELARALRTPVVAAFDGRRFPLSPRAAQLRVDVDAIVDRALERSRQGILFARVARDLTGGAVDVALTPQVRFSRRALDRFVADVADRLDRPPKDAEIAFGGDTLGEVEAQRGIEVRRRQLRRAVARALRATDPARRTVRVPARTVRPRVTTAELADRYPTVITVDRAGFRLHLWKRLRLVRSYPIAVGQVGLDTPAGLYEIQNKAVDPVWIVPNSAWAGELAGQHIPPGPSNPIKARWMGIYDGAGIHGTDAVDSLGTAASHGCIRMAIPDVIELYEQVPVGAPIYIA